MAIKYLAGSTVFATVGETLPTAPALAGWHAWVLDEPNGIFDIKMYDGSNWIDAGFARIDNDSLTVGAWSASKIIAELDTKVDKVAGKGLSDENFTTAEKDKLAGLESSKFVGQYTSLGALETANPTPAVGSYGFVDEGENEQVVKYIWDSDDEEWVKQLGESDELTAAQVKTLYESNADTNAFTDDEQTAVAANTAARHTQNTDTLLAEGTADEVSANEIREFLDNPPAGDGTAAGGEGAIQFADDDSGFDADTANFNFNKTTKVHGLKGYQQLEVATTSEPTGAHDKAINFVKHTDLGGGDTLIQYITKTGFGNVINFEYIAST